MGSALPETVAHQIIGFYTVPDDSDGVLKVKRSYQYFAASAVNGKIKYTETRQ
jgi:hypothetical protein